jgi:hypothetical protein
LVLGWLRRRGAAVVRARLGKDRIVLLDDRANSFGIESRGVTQIRGNGCLAATDDEILFVMWFPRRELRIPRERITAVEHATWHLGKSVARPLLRLRYINESGQDDSIAWFVRDLPAWETALS